MLTKNNNKTTKTQHARKARKSTPSTKANAQRGTWKEARPEKVARAKELLQDPDYPSAKIIHSVARLLAREWRK